MSSSISSRQSIDRAQATLTELLQFQEISQQQRQQPSLEHFSSLFFSFSEVIEKVKSLRDQKLLKQTNTEFRDALDNCELVSDNINNDCRVVLDKIVIKINNDARSLRAPGNMLSPMDISQICQRLFREIGTLQMLQPGSENHPKIAEALKIINQFPKTLSPHSHFSSSSSMSSLSTASSTTSSTSISSSSSSSSSESSSSSLSDASSSSSGSSSSESSSSSLSDASSSSSGSSSSESSSSSLSDTSSSSSLSSLSSTSSHSKVDLGFEPISSSIDEIVEQIQEVTRELWEINDKFLVEQYTTDFTYFAPIGLAFKRVSERGNKLVSLKFKHLQKFKEAVDDSMTVFRSAKKTFDTCIKNFVSNMQFQTSYLNRNRMTLSETEILRLCKSIDSTISALVEIRPSLKENQTIVDALKIIRKSQHIDSIPQFSFASSTSSSSSESSSSTTSSSSESSESSLPLQNTPLHLPELNLEIPPNFQVVSLRRIRKDGSSEILPISAGATFVSNTLSEYSDARSSSQGDEDMQAVIAQSEQEALDADIIMAITQSLVTSSNTSSSSSDQQEQTKKPTE